MTSHRKDFETISLPKRGIIFLLDPDACSPTYVQAVCDQAQKHKVSCLLVGGSILKKHSIQEAIDLIRKYSEIPVVLFPGPDQEISQDADAILFLSMINSAIPQMIIGKQTAQIATIKNSTMGIWPTAYVLLDKNKNTSAAQAAGPILELSMDEIIDYVQTAEILGLSHVFLDSGSGNVDQLVPSLLIKSIKKATKMTIWVGGGIQTQSQAQHYQKAGADYIVIGNALEKNVALLESWDKNILHHQ